jgi:hypothetical protein
MLPKEPVTCGSITSVRVELMVAVRERCDGTANYRNGLSL